MPPPREAALAIHHASPPPGRPAPARSRERDPLPQPSHSSIEQVCRHSWACSPRLPVNPTRFGRQAEEEEVGGRRRRLPRPFQPPPIRRFSLPRHEQQEVGGMEFGTAREERRQSVKAVGRLASDAGELETVNSSPTSQADEILYYKRRNSI
jgi:hypothetical protein